MNHNHTHEAGVSAPAFLMTGDEMKTLKVAGSFSGVGGLELGFKQAGNSVAVPVVRRIAEGIATALTASAEQRTAV